MASPCINLLSQSEHGVDLTFTSIQVKHLTLSGPDASPSKESLFFLNECIHFLYIFPKPEEVWFEFG